MAGTTGSSIGILIAPSITGENIERMAEKTFNEWHLGDRGVLLVLAMQDHRSRITTGKAVESILTDDLCVKILRETMRPHLRLGDVHGSLSEGVEMIRAVLQGQGDAGAMQGAQGAAR